MATQFSDNIEQKHPKPPTQYERKLVGGAWVDWASFTELNAAVASAYRKNKYFWVDGIYYQCNNDGITYRIIGGTGAGAMQALKFAINADGSGTPDSTFDGYKAAGALLSDPKLENVKIIAIMASGTVFQEFFPLSANYVPYTSGVGEGTLNFGPVGDLSINTFVIILYQPL